MRILHIGYGYPPIASGGGTRYAMDLMAIQAASGHEVAYLCAGRYAPFRQTALKHWKMGKVRVFEIVNPPSESILPARIAHPTIDTQDDRMDALARSAVQQIRPDVAHIQDMIGWPASLIAVLGQAGIAAIYTAEIYECICPNKKLYYLSADEPCGDLAEGRRCVRCNQSLPSSRFLINATKFRLTRLAKAFPWVSEAMRAAKRRFFPRKLAAKMSPARLPEKSSLSEEFLARHRAYVEALNRIEIVVGMSGRVTEILAEHGVHRDRLRTLHLTLGDMDKIVRRPPRTPGLPIRFGLLNKVTHLKGGTILAHAFAGLDPRQVRLLIFGNQSADAVAQLRPLIDSGVAELRGLYARGQINAILNEIDVGLVPSIWEEAYGYVGPEFLAGGIPLLASRIGGIPDYVEDGVNGFLLPPREPEAWHAKLLEFVADPSVVERLARGIKPVKTMAEHLPEIEALYREARALRSQRCGNGCLSGGEARDAR